MDRPRRFLVRMIIFLVAVLVVLAVLFPQLQDAFLANVPLNGLILGVLLLGIVYNFRQDQPVQGHVGQEGVLQLMAYAGGESLSSGKARRLSLSRALSVRSYLIENGVRSTRIDVRALGNKTAEEPLNRVDVTIAER